MRTFKGCLPNGTLVVAYGNCDGYFSIITDYGAQLDLIAAAIPEARPLIDLHLADENGVPMHAVANARFFADEQRDGALAQHLRIPLEEARALIDEYRWACREIDDRVKARVSAAQHRLQQAVEPLTELRRVGGVFNTLEREFLQARKTLKDLLRDTEIREVVSNPVYAHLYQRVTSRLPYHWATSSGPSLDGLLREVDHLLQLVSNAVRGVRTMALRVEAYNQYWESLIDACFRSCWQRRAEEAKKLLETEEPFLSRTLKQPDEATPAVYLDELWAKVVEIRTDNYLPLISLGNLEFVVAESEQAAAEAVRNELMDLANNNPNELAELVGTNALRNWALGQSAQLGEHTVDNFLEWVDLVAQHPEEHWATYDGRARKLKINQPLADALGFNTTIVIGYQR